MAALLFEAICAQARLAYNESRGYRTFISAVRHAVQ
jgi:hypothetical protein